MQAARVTLVIVHRERYSYPQKSLENIYQNTHIPFDIIYINVNSPSRVRHYIEAQYDADYLWTPDKLERQLQALKTHLEAEIAYN